ncbi:hypothetical protein E4U15_008265 [Claviceps sp. LM218 group G6]|nr:hypothetical protein E4U15_008265 [Claviceps sp. LM218 group G6]
MSRAARIVDEVCVASNLTDFASWVDRVQHDLLRAAFSRPAPGSAHPCAAFADPLAVVVDLCAFLHSAPSIKHRSWTNTRLAPSVASRVLELEETRRTLASMVQQLQHKVDQIQSQILHIQHTDQQLQQAGQQIQQKDKSTYFMQYARMCEQQSLSLTALRIGTQHSQPLIPQDLPKSIQEEDERTQPSTLIQNA